MGAVTLHNVDPVDLLNGGSGALFVLLGLFVARVDRRNLSNAGFALFAGCFGAGLIGLNLFTHSDGAHWAFLTGGLLLAAIPGVLLLSAGVGDARGGERALVVGLAALLGLVMLARDVQLGREPWTEHWEEAFAVGALQGALWGAGLVLARRAARSNDAGIRRRLVLTGCALALYPAYFAGDFLIPAILEDGAPSYADATRMALAGVFAGAWLWASRIEPTARWPAWVALASMLAAILATAFGEVNYGYGIVRAIAVLLLAYGILRYQLLGLDVRVRWAMSRSTLGALFITAFFVASEVAQRYFEASVGPYLGIVAAGGLVFALAPLQRLTDRLADAALPGGASAPSTSAGRERAYLAAWRIALRAGPVRPGDEEELMHLADELGIGARKALEIRRAAEAESPPS